MATLEDYVGPYEQLFGFVPPRVLDRIKMGLELDPKLLELVERTRAASLHPDVLDTKTAQMIAFGILLGQLSDGAELHARAAFRAGATKSELHAVVALAFLYSGLSAFNKGVGMIDRASSEK